MRDIATAMAWNDLANTLNEGPVRVILALLLLWTFVLINIRGLKVYERTLIPLMVLMFTLGGIVIITGLMHTPKEFADALLAKEGKTIPQTTADFNLNTFLSAAALLFASFIGFDSIAQAGGEAKNPTRNLPRAIGIAIVTVSLFYMLFSFSVYHAVPWQFVAEQAQIKDITAPGLLSYLIPSGWAVLIVLGATVALTNDLPAMILSVSRLMFSWAEDGIFPQHISKVHPTYHTPHRAILLSGVMATIGILGSHFAGDFFLGIDIMVTSMLVNFMLMCLSVVMLPTHNPVLASQISVFKSRALQLFLGVSGTILLTAFLIIHITKDLNANVSAWYFHSTPVWLIVMALASILFFYQYNKLKKSGTDTKKLFSQLPPE